MADDDTTPEGHPPWAQPGDAPRFIPAPTPPGTASTGEPGAPTDPTALRDLVQPSVPDRPTPVPGRTPTTEHEVTRPLPSPASLGAAAGGIVVVFGLLALLSDDGVSDSRGTVAAISLAFVLGGGAVTWLLRGQRAAAGGVAISALAAIPLFDALFRDPQDALKAFSDPESYRNTQVAILACLAVVWLAGYAFGPGRRHGLFLGAGITALWLIPMTWFSLSAAAKALGPISSLIDGFGSGSSGFDLTDPGSTGGSGLPGGATPGLDSLMGGGGGNDHLSLKLGLTSLLFGGAYLVAAALLDRRRDLRMATPFFAAAAIILWQAIGYLEEDLKVGGACTLALALGGVGIWLGSRTGRRFTSWLGVLAAAISVVRLADSALDSRTVPIGLLLTIVGAAAVVGFAALERAGAFGGGTSEPSGPAGPSAEPPADLSGPPTSAAPDPWAPPAAPPHGTF